MFTFQLLLPGQSVLYDCQTEDGLHFYCVWYNQKPMGDYPPPRDLFLTKVAEGWQSSSRSQWADQLIRELERELKGNEELRAYLSTLQ